MTVKVNYLGGLVWYRTDSYWDGTAFEAGSTWGPGIKLSAHYVTSKDNNGTANLGKTYVFAMGDGSGVALHHLTYDTYAPTTFTTAGTGTNNVVSGVDSFTNTFPNLYSMDYCSTTNIKLSGTGNTEDLTAEVKAWSDGYKMTSTISMQMIIAGGKDGWRGTCLVYYTDDNIMDSTEGTVCHVHVHETLITAGPMDFGASYLVHILPA